MKPLPKKFSGYATERLLPLAIETASEMKPKTQA